MGGISTGGGLFSGIDTRSIIEQLLAVESRPKIIMQRRSIQLQAQQSAYLDLNSRLDALKTAAGKFRVNKLFSKMSAASSDPEVLRATATQGAQPGAYSFLVDRLVSSRQLLSKGFADRDSAAVGADRFTFESNKARLDRDMELAALNGGDGVQRGKLVIRQGSAHATIDLTRAVTVRDVLDAINTQSDVDVRASVRDGGLVLTSESGGFTVEDAVGYSTASELGIAGSSGDVGGTHTLDGVEVYRLGAETGLGALNDGNGVFISDTVGQGRYDFAIIVGAGGSDPTEVRVNVGGVYASDATLLEAEANSVGQVIERINTAIADAGVAGLTAQVSADGARLELVNTSGQAIEVREASSGSTARDLGLRTSGPVGGTLSGRRLLAGLNGTLISNLNGGSGLTGDGQVQFTARDGTVIDADVSAAETVQEAIEMINAAAGNGGRIVASLNDAGTGLLIADTTGGSGALSIVGDGASDLGIATAEGGVLADSFRGANLQHAYVSSATLLSEYNDGKGVGTGEFRIIDSKGIITRITVSASTRTVRDLLRDVQGQLNSNGSSAEVAINGSGDGLVVREKQGETGASAIRVEDVTGSVARNLGIAGEAAGTGEENHIDGTLEKVVEFEPGDTLEDVARKINEAGGPAFASIVNDGSSGRPYRLSIGAKATGVDGRFVFDSHGFDLGMRVMDRGEDARVFYGSSDPASAILVTSSSNTLDDVVTGLSIDLLSAGEDPVQVTVSRDGETLEKEVQAFVDAFNAVIERIDRQTRYDDETKERGPLLGDGTAQRLRQQLFSTVQREGIGLSGPFTRLVEVGVKVGQGGKLELDRDRLRAAMEEDYDSVAELFEARVLEEKDDFIDVGPGIKVRNPDPKDSFSKLGVLGVIEEFAKGWTDSVDGTLKVRRDALERQIEIQNKRIEAFDGRLERRREQLERQFLAMEQSIALLQSQQGALSALAGLIG